jgi:pimeloyl-ACP methyl ester carboxylesterase
MYKINVNDQEVNYYQNGKGKDIVFLHGWGQNISMMEPIAKAFEYDFRVTIIDFPGFGESPEPKEVWTVYDYEKMLADFFEQLGIENPIIIAHSFGARISTIYASKNPVEKLIYTGAAGIKPRRSLWFYMKLYTFKLLKFLTKLPLLSDYHEDVRKFFGSTDYNDASLVMRGILVNVVNEDLSHLLKEIKAPTLLMWGELDDATPLKDAKKMEKLIPDAGLVVMPGYGHFGYYNNKNYFIKVVGHFLTSEEV